MDIAIYAATLALLAAASCLAIGLTALSCWWYRRTARRELTDPPHAFNRRNAEHWANASIYLAWWCLGVWGTVGLLSATLSFISG